MEWPSSDEPFAPMAPPITRAGTVGRGDCWQLLVRSRELAVTGGALQRELVEDGAMAVVSRGRMNWSVQGGNEESRAYLQARLIVLAGLMFWSFLVLLAFMGVLYFILYTDLPRPDRPDEPGLHPTWNEEIYGISICGLILLGALRRTLRRYTLSIQSSKRSTSCSPSAPASSLRTSAMLAYDLRPSAYICLIYACLMVLLRAIIVPSTGRRTAIMGIATCFPMTIATVALVYLNDQDIPGPAYVGGGVLICVDGDPARDRSARTSSTACASR